MILKQNFLPNLKKMGKSTFRAGQLRFHKGKWNKGIGCPWSKYFLKLISNPVLTFNLGYYVFFMVD